MNVESWPRLHPSTETQKGEMVSRSPPNGASWRGAPVGGPLLHPGLREDRQSAARKHIRHAFDGLALPIADLVRAKPMLHSMHRPARPHRGHGPPHPGSSARRAKRQARPSPRTAPEIPTCRQVSPSSSGVTHWPSVPMSGNESRRAGLVVRLFSLRRRRATDGARQEPRRPEPRAEQ